MTDIEFINTFIGECQHLGYRVISPAGARPYYRCMLCFELRGLTYRCNSGRPLTDQEIRERKKR